MAAHQLSTSKYKGKYNLFLACLKKARQDAGLTQTQVAHYLGKNQDWVSRCETGEHRVDIVELLAFCRLYKKDLEYFVEAMNGEK